MGGDHQATSSRDGVPGQFKQHRGSAKQCLDDDQDERGYCEPVEARPFPAHLEATDEKPDAQQQHDSGQGPVAVLDEHLRVEAERNHFAVAGGPVAAAAGPRAGGTYERPLQDDDHVHHERSDGKLSNVYAQKSH